MRIAAYYLIACLGCAAPSLTAQYLPAFDAERVDYRIQVEGLHAAYPANLIVEGSEAIGGLLYKKAFLDGNHIGWARENPAEGKMWFRWASDGSETLVMDLSLEAGDTFDIYWQSSCDAYFPDLPVRVPVLDASYQDGRKTLTLEWDAGGYFFCDTLRFIEGVGPSATLLLQAYFPRVAFSQRLCKMSKADTLYYQALPDSLCGLTVSVPPTPQAALFLRVYPNPASGEIHVASSLPVAELQLFSHQGQPVAAAARSTTLALGGLPRGLYLLRVVLEDGQAVWEKVVVDGG
jgi:hypothetical protein